MDIKARIEDGTLNPSVRQIQKQYNAKYDYARDVLAELNDMGLLERNEQNGQYRRI